MCGPAAALLIGSALTQAYGQYQQGQVAKDVGRNNQIMAEYAAQDAQRRGEEQAQSLRRRGEQVKGSQRAIMAAKGLDLGEGTAAELQAQTDFFSETDQATARSNAAREAWSNRVAGANARAQGEAAARQGTIGAFSTVLGSASQVAGKWYDSKMPPPPIGSGAGGAGAFGGGV